MLSTLVGNQVDSEPSISIGDHTFARYLLSYRQGILFVTTIDRQRLGSSNQDLTPQQQKELVKQLKGSSLRLISVDPEVGEEAIKLWAEIGKQVGLSVFIRLPSLGDLPIKKKPFMWWLKRLTDWLAASLILALLSPILVVIASLISLMSPGPIFFRQWRVGERGKLFQIYKFRTMIVGADRLHSSVMGAQTGLHKLKDDPRVTPLGRLLRKYSLDEFPQLFNVLFGEMSLVGPRPWALFDALRIKPDGQHRLNALPGITGAWQVQARSTLLDLDAVNHCDIQYLQSWSIIRDFRILLMTVPKVISGSGAY